MWERLRDWLLRVIGRDNAATNKEIAKRVDALTDQLDKGGKLKSEVDRQSRRS